MARQVSVRLRLIPVSLFTSLVAILLTGGLLVWDQHGEARRGLMRDAATQARIIGDTCSAALLFGDAKAAEENLASLRANPDILVAAVYGQDDGLFASYRSERAKSAEAPGRPGVPGEEFRAGVMEITAPMESEGKRTGAVFLRYDLSALDARLSRLMLLVAGVAGGALAVAYLLLARLQSSITAPFQSVARLMEEVAQGDLTGSVQIAGGGELGRLGDSITGTIAKLRDIIGRVDESFILVERVAGELDGLSRALSDGARTEEEVVGTLTGTTASLSATADRVSGETLVLQESSERNLSSLLELARAVQVVAQDAEAFAGSAGGTSSAIHEMSASLAQVDERISRLSGILQETSATMTEIDHAVGEVKDLSSRTRHVAGGLFALASEQGGTAMSRAEQGMGSIRDLVASLGETVRSVGRRSEEITAIVSLVAEIADHTNLLALNASILAAQAGEQGRGFAVVAQEIRKLSSRTDESIKRISAHVEGIQEDSRRAVAEVSRGAAVAEHGAAQVAEVAAVLERVVAGADETRELNAQIAERADRQAEESARITGALVDISHMAVELLRASREQKQTSGQILGIADETGHKAGLMKRSAEEQLTTVSHLQGEAEGSAAMGERLLEGAAASRAAVGAVLEATRIIEAAIRENRTRAQALRAAIEQLGAQSGEIRARLAGFRLRL
jgi:methyl-accepting chemotaxis protein